MKTIMILLLAVMLVSVIACGKETQEEAKDAAIAEDTLAPELKLAGRWNTSNDGWIEFSEDNEFTTDAGELGIYTLTQGDPIKIKLESDTRDHEYVVDIPAEGEMHWMLNGVIYLTLIKSTKAGQ